VWKHPKYYAELKRIAKEQADKRASQQGNERASKQKVTSGSRASKK
jgi:hypothetical protein